MRALLQRTLGSADVFDRFAEGNPLGDFVAVVAEQAGALVGFNLWNPWLVHTADGPVTAYQSGASVVDPSMRGQGVFGRLLRTGEGVAYDRGIAMLFGFPNPASLPAFIKGGWVHARSLRVFVSPIPSMGFGPRSEPSPAPTTTGGQTGAAAARFVAWRYARAGVAPRPAVLRDGRAVTVYARTQRRLGVTLNKLLDVVDESGRRVTDALGGISATLPGPGLTFVRAVNGPPGLPPWLPVRRRWETPLVLKRLGAGTGPDDASFHGASYWYGDIDAS